MVSYPALLDGFDQLLSKRTLHFTHGLIVLYLVQFFKQIQGRPTLHLLRAADDLAAPGTGVLS